MRFAVSIPNFGPGLGAALVGDWAAEAEAGGWDGFFLWDHLLAFDPGAIDVVDAWMALAVAATRTSRVRLGTMVTPLPRRRPVKLAREVTTLDRLSGGRAVLGVGIGAMPFEWDYLGEESDLRRRGQMLDEHLELLERIWSGEPVDHAGEHYRASGGPSASTWKGVFHPTPVRGGRVPVWVAGTWPGTRPFRRAARWDGVVPMRVDGAWEVDDTRAVVAYIERHRGREVGRDGAFAVVVAGETDPADAARRERFAAHEAAGATWWVEGVHPWRYGWKAGDPLPEARMRGRLQAGP
ncbi:MAG: LLM class flavin-dependent oxidoreductase [Terrabacter sp.]